MAASALHPLYLPTAAHAHAFTEACMHGQMTWHGAAAFGPLRSPTVYAAFGPLRLSHHLLCCGMTQLPAHPAPDPLPTMPHCACLPE
eukprot:363049-Chlamydomonas_euryale.AAC.8